MNKTKAKRAEHLEDVCMGAGFLLKKLRSQYGKHFGEGMWQQVNQCINDCDNVVRARSDREAARKEPS